jgi:tetratricopeptide (TPR) repeat protein
VQRFFTPLLRRLYFFAGTFLIIYFTLWLGQYTPWNKERLFRKLVVGDRQQKSSAAFDLVWLGGEAQLLRALKSRSHSTREIATDSLWNLWFHAAGDDAFGMIQKANGAVERKEFDRALALLNRVIREYPRFAEGWNRRAVLHWQMERYEQSIADCKRVVALNPSHFGAWQGMGLCQLHLGDLEGACESLRAALKINPHDRGLQYLLRQCEELLRKFSPDRQIPLDLV